MYDFVGKYKCLKLTQKEAKLEETNIQVELVRISKE